MLTWDCGRDQQEKHTLNSKCEVIKLVIAVKIYSQVSFFNKKGSAKFTK